MFEYIRGNYVGMNKDYVIIENNGLAYKIYTSGSTIAKLPKIGEEILLYIQMIVREDFIGLYGFLTREELDMFNLLLTINGVGAKASLSLLSISSVNNLKYAILSEDAKTLIRAPGIGKKIAQRIILELRDKIKSDKVHIGNIMEIESSETENNTIEALAALISLGYSEKEAKNALATADMSDTLENIIKKCLKHLMN